MRRRFVSFKLCAHSLDLRCDPAVPRGMHWRLIGAAHDGDPQWAAYLTESSAA